MSWPATSCAPRNRAPTTTMAARKCFAALPEYSTPATPVAANAAVEPAAFNKLKADFSSCLLPYSQALDVSRTYLRHLGSCRFEEMRTFRKCITEFVLDPAHEPAGFQDWLWRYPVRIDIAMEYLGITPEEYTGVFRERGAPCTAASRRPRRTGSAGTARRIAVARGRGRPVAAVPAALRGTIGLPAFLAETCLSYCEFYELWQSGFVAFRNGADERDGGRSRSASRAAWTICRWCSPRSSRSRTWRNCGCSSGSGASCGTRAASAIRSRSCATSAMCCSCTRAARSTRTSSASSPRSRCCATTSTMDLADPDASLSPARSTPTARSCWRSGLVRRRPKWTWAVRQLICGVEHHAQRRA